MNSYECPGCGYVMSEKEEKCKYCGSSNPRYVAPKTSFIATPAPVSSQSSSTSQPVKKEEKKINVLVFILLLLFFWPGALIYAIVCAAR